MRIMFCCLLLATLAGCQSEPAPPAVPEPLSTQAPARAALPAAG